MRRLLLCLALAALFLATSCSPATSPSGGTDPIGNAELDGEFDADSGHFTLTIIDDSDPDNGPPLHVELIGGELTLNPEDDTLSLNVAIRNLGAPLHPALIVWITDLTPAFVTVLNPDAIRPNPDAADLLPLAYGFDYSELLGDDDVLSTGELSGSREWLFHDPGLGSFSFGARLEAGLEPDLPRIAGRCFVDLNHDGLPGPGEPPLPAELRLTGPAGEATILFTDPHGGYAFPVLETGLYRLDCFPLEGPESPPELPWRFTTPNPLELLLLPGPDGLPISFLHAHFGAYRGGPDPPPVRFTDLPPDSLHFAHWQLLNAEIHGDRIDLHLGFSGCQPEHPFSLWISQGFMESWPVQVNAVLVHELDEDCDAWWQAERGFDLRPLKDAYLEAYGEPALLIMNLIDFQGEAHPLEYWIGEPDSLPLGLPYRSRASSPSRFH
jgi:hypothetical protein